MCKANLQTTAKYTETKLRTRNIVYAHIKKYFPSLLTGRMATVASYKITAMLVKKKKKPVEDGSMIKECLVVAGDYLMI
jgi:hypothetical protein